MANKIEFVEMMKARTKRFTLDIIDFCSKLPKNHATYRIGDQLLQSGTSVGANYRAALVELVRRLSFTVKYHLL